MPRGKEGVMALRGCSSSVFLCTLAVRLAPISGRRLKGQSGKFWGRCGSTTVPCVDALWLLVLTPVAAKGLFRAGGQMRGKRMALGCGAECMEAVQHVCILRCMR